MTRLFISYSHADEKLKHELDKHLKVLEHSKVIEPWHDRMLRAGDDFADEIDVHLKEADIILLLVSHHFISSHYCYGIEMAQALERERKKEARVIPVILDHCVWDTTPFAHLTALPTDAKPLTMFANINEGFTDVVRGIRKAAEATGKSKQITVLPPPPAEAPVISLPRSTNLSVKTELTQRDKDQFVIETFDYISRFFEGSLRELPNRNPDAQIEVHFEKVDSGTFSAVIYRRGKNVSECTITRKHCVMGEISFSRSLKISSNSVGDALHIQEKDGVLTFKPLMPGFHHRQNQDGDLGQEGAARYYWDLFFEPLTR
jgi:hypothetical protein